MSWIYPHVHRSSQSLYFLPKLTQWPAHWCPTSSLAPISVIHHYDISHFKTNILNLSSVLFLSWGCSLATWYCWAVDCGLDWAECPDGLLNLAASWCWQLAGSSAGVGCVPQFFCVAWAQELVIQEEGIGSWQSSSGLGLEVPELSFHCLLIVKPRVKGNAGITGGHLWRLAIMIPFRQFSSFQRHLFFFS